MTFLAKFFGQSTSNPKSGKQSPDYRFPNPSSNTTPDTSLSADLSKFFSEYELRCRGKNCGCGNKVILDPVFQKKLLDLRLDFDHSIIVNSCCRCKVHNSNVGGKGRSFHISDEPAWPGLFGTGAIDIPYKNTAYRNTLARLAWKHGFRLGLHRSFLHIDIGAIKGYMPQSIFKYDNISDKQLADFKQQVIGETNG